MGRGARASALLSVTATVAALLHCGDDDGGATSVVDASASDVTSEAGPSETSTSDATAFAPTEAKVIASSAGKDEDPSLVRASDGTFYLAWFSNRDGGDHLYLSSSKNGLDWTAARGITSGPEHDFYPSLIQAADGTFHLTWWRGALSDAGTIVGSIWTMSSKDTLTWSTPTALTSANALAWVPTIAERVPGELFVVWSTDEGGQKDLRYRIFKNGSWEAPVTIVDPMFADDLPFVVARPGGVLALVWERFDPAQTAFEAPFTSLSTDLVYATSADGTTWSTPTQITFDDGATKLPDVIPSLYPSNDPSGLSVVWTSVRSASDQGSIYSLGASAAPAGATNVRKVTSEPGYSARLVPLGADLYLLAWVGRVPASDGGVNLEIFSKIVALP